MLVFVVCWLLTVLYPFHQLCHISGIIVFFKPKANLPDSRKARIEFHLQQLAECIGFDRFRLPVLNRKDLMGMYESGQRTQQVIDAVGNHLAHDVSQLRLHIVPQPVQSCSSGGG